MKIENKDNYSLIITEENSFSQFQKTFESEYEKVRDNHLIICFSEEINTTIKDLLLLLPVSSAHKKRKLSFICVANQVEIDDIPEEFSVVPTLEEAEDVLEMDEIERDLGF